MATYQRGGTRVSVSDGNEYTFRALAMETLEPRLLFSQPPLTVQPPTAYLVSAPDVRDGGGAAVDVNVQYSDTAQFDFNSFNDNNIAITGPNGALTTSTLTVNTSSSTDNFVNVDYTFAAPNGGWDASDNGVYTIATSSSSAVTDANTAAVPHLTLGTFRVFIGQNNPGFSSGTVTTNFSTQAITELGDGSYIAVGSQPDGSGTQGKTQLVVQKYGGDGGSDFTFGGGDGRVALQYGSSSVGYGVAVQNNGDLVIAGSANNSSNSATDFTVFRLGPGGIPDNTFGQDLNGDGTPDGLETIDVGGTNPVAYDAAVQPDGGIIAVGTTSTAGGGDFVVARIDPNTNVLDTTFGTNGFTTTSFGSDSAAGALLLLPNNDILVAGNAGNNVVLARYTPQGALDTTFGTNGTMIVPDLISSTWNVALALEPSGKVLVGAQDSDGATAAVVRLNSDGSLDTTFGSNGLVGATPAGGSAVTSSILVQAGGQIDVGYIVNNGGDFSGGINTYTNAGAPENNFSGTNGISIGSTSSSGVTARTAMALTPGGVVFAQTIGAGAQQQNSGTTQLNKVVTDAIAPTATFTPTTVTAATATATFTVTYNDSVGIDPTTVAAGNVTVSDGTETLAVTSAVIDVDSPGSPRTATYTVTAPHGTFSSTDNGAYTVDLLASVKDTAGNAVTPNAHLGVLTISESAAPVPVPTLTAPNLSTNNSSSYSFTVTYADSLGINVATVSTGNVTVTGPNGALAVTSAVPNVSTNGTPRTVTYTVAAPHDVFSTADNGAYTIGMTNTLQDVSGNPTAVNAALGTFTVAVTNSPRTLLGSFGTVAGAKKAQKLSVSVNGVPTVFSVTNGSGQAFLNGTAVDLVITAATGKKAAITVAPKGGRITLGSVVVTGNVGTFAAKTSDLTGSFYVSGAASTITLGNLTNATFDVAAPIGTFSAISLTDSKVLDGVSAGPDGTLATTDDSFGAGSINALTIAGPINASVIAAGANPVNGVFGDGDDTLAGAGSIIKTITAKGGTTGATVFESGSFKAASLPKKIKTISADSRFKILT